MMAFIPSWLKKWVLAIGSMIALGISTWVIGRSGGIKKQKAKQETDRLKNFKHTTESMNNAGTDLGSDDNILERLRKLGGQ